LSLSGLLRLLLCFLVVLRSAYGTRERNAAN
jgi:cbb3-type cytochrome oxidase subunit 3